METKRCTKCGEVKPMYKFSKEKRAKDGRKYKCKVCVSQSRRGERSNTNIKTVYSRIDSNLHKELKLEARKYSMPINQLLTSMIYFYFDNYKD